MRSRSHLNNQRLVPGSWGHAGTTSRLEIMDMNIEQMSPIQLRRQGLEALVAALGPVGTVRFLHQFDNGSGDYTQEREQRSAALSLEDILSDIEQRRQAQSEAND